MANADRFAAITRYGAVVTPHDEAPVLSAFDANPENSAGRNWSLQLKRLVADLSLDQHA
jgi:hypothetical protein